MPSPGEGRWRSIRRWTALGIGALIAGYSALVLNPYVLFAHEERVGNIVLHARAPFPPQAREIAAAARRRVERSPFFEPGDTYHVYFCDTPALFGLFGLWQRGAGALSQIYVTGNVYLRPSRIERDRLLGPAGREVPGDRTLTYFVAHELAHTMVARRLGRLAYTRLEVWQREGYADYLGKGGSFDPASTLRDFRANEPSLDPVRSGLYLRYHLLVAHLLDDEGMTAQELLKGPRAAEPLERELIGR
jgi:hypothetical protein